MIYVSTLEKNSRIHGGFRLDRGPAGVIFLAPHKLRDTLA